MQQILQKTILIMSAFTIYMVVTSTGQWEKILIHTVNYAVVSVLFLSLEGKYCGRFLTAEEQKKENDLIKKLKIKRTFYGGAIVVFFINSLIDILLLTTMGVMLLVYVVGTSFYVAATFRKLKMLEKEQITHIKERLEERKVQREFVPFQHHSPLEEKKNEVFDWLEKASEKINSSTEFASIENKILFTEAYKEGIQKKLSILENMSEEQRSFESKRVMEHMNKILHETKKFVG